MVVDYDIIELHRLLCAWVCPADQPVGSWAGNVSTWSRWMCNLFVWSLFSSIRPAVLFSGLSVLVPGSDGKQAPLGGGVGERGGLTSCMRLWLRLSLYISTSRRLAPFEKEKRRRKPGREPPHRKAKVVVGVNVSIFLSFLAWQDGPLPLQD